MKIDSSTIIKANAAILDAKIVNGGQYDKVFKGYISSFGASIAQAGLLPTLIFYENKSDKASERPKVISALKIMLPDEYHIDSLAKFLLEKKKENPNNYKSEERKLLNLVTDAMVAIKLALRLYEEKKDKEGRS